MISSGCAAGRIGDFQGVGDLAERFRPARPSLPGC
jgi:hypothetical protein